MLCHLSDVVICVFNINNYAHYLCDTLPNLANTCMQAMNKAEHLGHSSHQLPASGSHGGLLAAGATNSEAQLLDLATHLHNDPSVGREEK